MSRTREVGRKWRERCTHTWQCCGCSQRGCHLSNHRRRSQDVDWSITLTLLLFTHLVIFLQMFLVVSDPCSQSSNWAGKWKKGVSGLTQDIHLKDLWKHTLDFHWAAVVLIPLDFWNELFCFQLQLLTLETENIQQPHEYCINNNYGNVSHHLKLLSSHNSPGEKKIKQGKAIK